MLRVAQVLESEMRYAARTWDTERAARYVLDFDGRMVEFSHFRHFKAGVYVKDVLEIASSFGCTVGCFHCAAADLPHMQPLTAEEVVHASLFLARRHGLADSRKLLITFSGIGEASLLRSPMFAAAATLQTMYPHAEFVMTTVGIRPDFISAVGDLSTQLRLKYLQVSVFSVDSETVQSVMPLGRRLGYSTQDLVGALSAESRLRYRLNYVVIEGLNSEASQVDAVLRLFEPVRRQSVLRVSRLNETSASKRNKLSQPAVHAVQSVADRATAAGWDAYHFYSHGDDRLNCGQLAGSYLVSLGMPKLRPEPRGTDDSATSAGEPRGANAAG